MGLVAPHGRVFQIFGSALVALAAVAGCGNASESKHAASGGQAGTRNDGGAGDSADPGEGGRTGVGQGGSSQAGSGGAGRNPASAGSAGRSSPAAGTSSSASAAGGGTGVGGFGGVAAMGGERAAGGGGTQAGSGGMGACIEGASCTCEEGVGILECAPDGPHCTCPPTNECVFETESCFEPCGGEPFGSWALDKACLSGNEAQPGCSGAQLQGTGAESDLSLRFLEGGVFDARGSEVWEEQARVPLECFQIESINRCQDASFYSAPFLFGSAREMDCEANACGFCDCAGKITAFPGHQAQWRRTGNVLTLGSIEVPYCVQGDVLWIGGKGRDGSAKAAYRFKKQSCTGTPLPCEERTLARCAADDGCAIGHCKAQSASQPRCGDAFSEQDCSVLQGCTWDPNGCWGSSYETCSFDTCGTVPGCSWGPPMARCGGEPLPCGSRAVADCKADGCSLRTCEPDSNDAQSCQKLSAAACKKAPGCNLSGTTTCIGQTKCSVQTDSAACSELECFASDVQLCGGTPSTVCSQLSVDDCHSEPGCGIEW